jgi:RND superfamily putative drug exporter
LLPAVLELLGRTTWALPSWLDRRLPNVAIDADPGSGGRPALEPALEAGS